jgi:hypothetical protein
MNERALRGLFIATLLPLLPGCSEGDSTNLQAIADDVPSSPAPSAPAPSTGTPSAETPSTPGVETPSTGTPVTGNEAPSEPSPTPGTDVETVVEPVLPAAGALFAVPTEVYGPGFETSASYVPVVPSLDVARIDLGSAREVGGRASVATVGQWLFIASSQAPVINRFEIAADGSLRDAGSLSFANYGVPEFFSIDPWGGVFINSAKAYIFNGSDGSHVVWNPTTLEITGEIAAPGIPRNGYNFESVSVVRGNRLYRIFTLLNYDTWEFLPAPQYLVVYDLTNDTVVSTSEETRCPQLYSRPFIDEQGDIYFSGWVWTPGLALTGDYPTSCALRVPAGQDTFDPTWQLNFGAEVTGGREAGIMRYLGGGRALLDVFYSERTTVDASTDPQELVNTPNWRLWSIDLESKTGAPVEGLDFKAGGYQDVAVADRTFLMVPNNDYSETTGYEVKDGQAVRGFAIQGSSYHMVKLR